MSSATGSSPAPSPSIPAVVAAFLAVYLIWGSTYLAIRFAIETLPPFLMAGTRFLVAGAVLFLWARSRGVPVPTRTQLRDAAVVGALLLWLGNGGVVWAQQWVPSGLTALLVATVPFWMVLLDWIWGGGERPRAGVWVALLVGLAGVGVLAGAEGAGSARERLGAGVLLLAALSWAVGSIHSRKARIPAAPRMATALQMLTGGFLLFATGTALGEWGSVDPEAVTTRSVLALVYLTVFGSLVAFSAYIWLLQVSTPARVSTYAYVNPVVALFLGWALADEPIGGRTVLAAGLILASVMTLNLIGRRRRIPPPPATPPVRTADSD